MNKNIVFIKLLHIIHYFIHNYHLLLQKYEGNFAIILSLTFSIPNNLSLKPNLFLITIPITLFSFSLPLLFPIPLPPFPFRKPNTPKFTNTILHRSYRFQREVPNCLMMRLKGAYREESWHRKKKNKKLCHDYILQLQQTPTKN